MKFPIILTRKQYKIARLLRVRLWGNSHRTQYISKKIGICLSTLYSHIRRIQKKTETNSITDLRFFLKLNWERIRPENSTERSARFAAAGRMKGKSITSHHK